ncbi:hypothetical protein NQL31_007338 [Lotmaria passim]
MASSSPADGVWRCAACHKVKDLKGPHLNGKTSVRSDCWPCAKKTTFVLDVAATATGLKDGAPVEGRPKPPISTPAESTLAAAAPANSDAKAPAASPFKSAFASAAAPANSDAKAPAASPFKSAFVAATDAGAAAITSPSKDPERGTDSANGGHGVWRCAACHKVKDLKGPHLNGKTSVRSDCWPCAKKTTFVLERNDPTDGASQAGTTCAVVQVDVSRRSEADLCKKASVFVSPVVPPDGEEVKHLLPVEKVEPVLFVSPVPAVAVSTPAPSALASSSPADGVWRCAACHKVKDLKGPHLNGKTSVRSDCWPCAKKTTFVLDVAATATGLKDGAPVEGRPKPPISTPAESTLAAAAPANSDAKTPAASPFKSAFVSAVADMSQNGVLESRRTGSLRDSTTLEASVPSVKSADVSNGKAVAGGGYVKDSVELVSYLPGEFFTGGGDSKKCVTKPSSGESAELPASPARGASEPGAARGCSKPFDAGFDGIDAASVKKNGGKVGLADAASTMQSSSAAATVTSTNGLNFTEGLVSVFADGGGSKGGISPFSLDALPAQRSNIVTFPPPAAAQPIFNRGGAKDENVACVFDAAAAKKKDAVSKAPGAAAAEEGGSSFVFDGKSPAAANVVRNDVGFAKGVAGNSAAGTRSTSNAATGAGQVSLRDSADSLLPVALAPRFSLEEVQELVSSALSEQRDLMRSEWEAFRKELLFDVRQAVSEASTRSVFAERADFEELAAEMNESLVRRHLAKAFRKL